MQTICSRLSFANCVQARRRPRIYRSRERLQMQLKQSEGRQSVCRTAFDVRIPDVSSRFFRVSSSLIDQHKP